MGLLAAKDLRSITGAQPKAEGLNTRVESVANAVAQISLSAGFLRSVANWSVSAPTADCARLVAARTASAPMIFVLTADFVFTWPVFLPSM